MGSSNSTCILIGVITTLITAFGSLAQHDTGMVLMLASEEAGFGDDGRLYVKYLSTGQDVVIQDGGETWELMHSGTDIGTGDGVTLDYVITDADLMNGTVMRTRADECYVRLNRYPDGYTTQSAMFSIVAGTGTVSERAAAAAKLSFRVSSAWSSQGSSLNVHAPAAGTIRVLDMQGRGTAPITVTAGSQSIPMGTMQAGRYLVMFTSADGRNDGMLVTHR